jgi:hypothetical protein
MKINELYIGTWFQRTTLHLSELWKVLDLEGPQTLFIENDLQPLRKNLNISASKRVVDGFECIEFITNDGIVGTIHEDGLMVVGLKDISEIDTSKQILKDYYEKSLSPAVSYLFSRGAPIPKELANIPTVLPYMFVVSNTNKDEIIKTFFNEERLHSVTEGKTTNVYKGSSTLVLQDPVSIEQSALIVETNIFFREFKVQLERYLSIHRTLWEKIKEVVDSDSIKGTDIEPIRTELQGYQKTINLIEARINQMPTYVKTRQKLTTIEGDDDLVALTNLRFEDLLDTHEYIKHLWSMTKNYLQSALDMLTAIQNESTKTSISSLQLITTIGVVSGLTAYLTKDGLPPVTQFGLIYFAVLLLVTWTINKTISYIYKHKLYKFKKSENNKI